MPRKSSNRDDFSENVKRNIAARVGNRCCHPDCNALTSGPHSDAGKSLNVGVAGHITAAAPGGPRYDPSLAPEQRKGENNAIWLCQTHGKLVDNDETQWTENTLRQWKRDAEAAALEDIGKTRPKNNASAPTPNAPVFPIFATSIHRNPFFTGRESLLEELRAALISNGTTTLTQPQAVSGLGGIGKTQVAAEYAHRHANDYKAVFWVGAATESELLAGFATIARLLHLPEKNEADHKIVVEAVHQWLQSHPDWLLILDNADTPAIVKAFLPPLLHGHVLLTTRRRVLHELSIAQPIQIKTLPLEDAAQFLLNRTGRSNTEADEKNAARQLAQELGGLPLALEQAAAYIVESSASFGDYTAAYLRQRLQRLEQQTPVEGNYPLSVATTWELNFAEVEARTPASADFLRTAAFLEADDVPLELLVNGGLFLGEELARAFHPDERKRNPLFLDDVLKPLMRYSLLERNVQNNSYSVHRLVQIVTQSRLDELNRREWAERVVRAVSCLRTSSDAPSFGTTARRRICSQDERCVKLIFEDEMRFQQAGDVLFNVAYALGARGLRLQAEPLLQRALEIAETNLGADHPGVACILEELSFVLLERAAYEQAEQVSQRAVSIMETFFGTDAPETLDFLYKQAILFKSKGRYAEAEEIFGRIYNLYSQSLGAESLQVARCLADWAEMRYRQGRDQEAEILFKRVLTIFGRTLPPEHPDVALVLNNYAGLLSRHKRFSEAEAALRQSIKSLEDSNDITSVIYASRLANLAATIQQQGRTDEAIEMLERARVVLEELLGLSHPRLATVLVNLAHLHAARGQHSEADASYCRTIGILTDLNPKHHQLPQALNEHAQLLRKIGRADEAYQADSRADWIRHHVEPRASMGRYGGRTIISVDWEERIPMRLLHEDWCAAINDAHRSIEESMKLRLEAENAGWFVANVNAQCQSNEQDFQNASDDDMATTRWICLCVVRQPEQTS